MNPTVETICKTLRQLSWQGEMSGDMLRKIADDVEKVDLKRDDICPICEEQDCDTDCPMEHLREARGEPVNLLTSESEGEIMSPEAQRIAIAEACGWRYLGSTCLKDRAWKNWVSPHSHNRKVPDYINDLNAMHEAEKIFPNGLWTRYCQYLCEIGKGSVRFVAVHATAAQRAEAFLRTLGKWEEK